MIHSQVDAFAQITAEKMKAKKNHLLSLCLSEKIFSFCYNILEKISIFKPDWHVPWNHLYFHLHFFWNMLFNKYWEPCLISPTFLLVFSIPQQLPLHIQILCLTTGSSCWWPRAAEIPPPERGAETLRVSREEKEVFWSLRAGIKYTLTSKDSAQILILQHLQG